MKGYRLTGGLNRPHYGFVWFKTLCDVKLPFFIVNLEKYVSYYTDSGALGLQEGDQLLGPV